MDSIHRILVIRFSAIGDIILITPVLCWLKQRFPEAELDVLVKHQFAGLLQNHPDVTHVITIKGHNWRQILELRKHLFRRHYDAVADLQAKLVSRVLALTIGASYVGLYRPQRWARFLLVTCRKNTYREIQPIPLRYLQAVKKWEVRADNSGASLYPGEGDYSTALQTVSDKNSNGLIALAPGASRYTKRWPDSYYQKVAQYFQEAGFTIILIGGTSDQEVCKRIARDLDVSAVDLSGKLQLMETAGWLKQSRLVITNDTGVMHMAGAVNTALVAIFGPTTHHLGFFPFRSKSIVVEHSNLSCRPCSFHGTKRCPKKHFRCMNEIQPEKVIQAAEQLLSGQVWN